MKSYSPSKEDYLESILLLSKTNGKAKSIDVAKSLNVSRPAVNLAMNELIKLGLVTKEAYSAIELTKAGRAIAEDVYNKHCILKTFLVKLGVPDKIAEIDCCKMEHDISDITLKIIEKFNADH